MTRLFIDTNVFLDVIMQREDYIAAANIFSLSQKKEFTLYASVLTMANIAYVLRKVIGIETLYTELSKFQSFVEIQSLSKNNYFEALKLRAKDFEDALQYSCAKSSNSNIIITRNKKDFAFEDIKAYTPSEFLSIQNIK